MRKYNSVLGRQVTFPSCSEIQKTDVRYAEKNLVIGKVVHVFEDDTHVFMTLEVKCADGFFVIDWIDRIRGSAVVVRYDNVHRTHIMCGTTKVVRKSHVIEDLFL